MNVVFRADSSAEIGSGHIVRCIALASALRTGGDECVFVSRPAVGDVTSLVEAAGFRVARLSGEYAGSPSRECEALAGALRAMGIERADWLVVDHYGLGIEFETVARTFADNILTIDDLAARAHDCDVLLDHNLGARAAAYEGFVPAGATVLAGPRFALLREQFASVGARDRDGAVRRILVCFGGTDPSDETSKALAAFAMVGETGIAVDVVVPEAAPHRLAAIGRAATVPGATVLGRVDDMASLMSDADLMIGAGGVTLLERAAVGLPSLSIQIADNQAHGTHAAASAGATVDLGSADAVTPEMIAAELSRLLADTDAVARMARAARGVAGPRPGSGPNIVAGLMRCVADPLGESRLRALRADDRERLLAWRNSDRVRFAMSNQHLVSESEHAAWFARTLEDECRRRFVYECGGIPLGLITFRDIDGSALACEWGFYVGEPWAPKGTGGRLGVLALDMAFDQLGLAEVRAEVLSDNVASLMFHARMGFTETGSITGPSPDGTAEMTWQTFAITKAEWAQHRPELVATYFRGDAS